MTAVTTDLRSIPGLVYVADYPPAMARTVAALLAEHPDLDVREIGRRMHAAGEPCPDVPSGLDARPTVRYTLHCSHCGKPHRDGDYDSITTWPADVLAELGRYEIDDWRWNAGADPEFEGRKLVCGSCWSSLWCDVCADPIHAWQPHGRDDRMFWHETCGRPVRSALLDGLEDGAAASFTGTLAGLQRRLTEMGSAWMDGVLLVDGEQVPFQVLPPLYAESGGLLAHGDTVTLTGMADKLREAPVLTVRQVAP